ncbi:hydroxyethylthiazole kinase [Candidatus Woesearchaeota archaeon]|nr:hydroxyethylthiazole kinase [Candidatus Woesearchaeota archaeon]
MTETAELLENVKKQKPLVYHITNWVTIYDCANIVRAIGALPVMAHAPEEAADMAGISGALVLNIGTLTTELVESMKIAGKAANKKGIPIVMDAVGVGATKLRDDKASELLNELKIDIIKGNASEIARLAGEEVQTKGVESSKVEANLVDLGRKLAEERDSAVVITGKEDIIVGGSRAYICRNGHDMMGKIVGTGCMAASVIGAFAAVEKDYAKAAASALACFGIAGELASRNSTGPGSYKQSFYDEIYNLNDTDIYDMEKLDAQNFSQEEKKEAAAPKEEEPEEEGKEEEPSEEELKEEPNEGENEEEPSAEEPEKEAAGEEAPEEEELKKESSQEEVPAAETTEGAEEGSGEDEAKTQ